jgi:rubrerythrin
MGYKRVQEETIYTCPRCGEYRLRKQYTGPARTTSEGEYNAIKPPDKCPVCETPITEK